MLDEYKMIQPIVYKILKNTVKKNRLSHAYIIEANNNRNAFNIAIAFAKYLFCPFNKTINENCVNCTQCQNIDNKNYPELKIIETDNSIWIKKEQLEELQIEFSKKAFLGTKKVYIINGAEKLNTSSSNTLLKFLEEPEENIIAILVVNSAHQLIDTVLSRCQIITLNKENELSNNILIKIANLLFNSEEKFVEFSQDEKNISKIENIIEFVRYYEFNKMKTILHTNELFHSCFKEKDDMILVFDIILLIYKDLVNIKLKGNIEIFTEYEEILMKIAKKNTLKGMYSKINIVLDSKNKVKYNANSNLLLDSLIIKLGGEKND